MTRYVVVGVALLVVGCGKEAVYQDKTVTEWREALKADDPAIRLEAANALGRLGREAKEAVPDLATALADKDEKVRAKAAHALWAMTDAAKEAIPALVDALKDSSPDVRMNAAGALASMGKDGQTAIPNLIETLADEDPYVVIEAAKALSRFGPAAKDAIPEMTKLLNDRYLTEVFKDRATSAEEQKDERNRTKVCVAGALASFGPEAAEAVPALTEMAKDPDGRVHGAALEAIRTIRAKK